MAELKQEQQYLLFDEQWLAEPPLTCCDPEYWQQEGKVQGYAKGRGISWFVAGQHMDMVLRHYYRGGLWGKWVKDRYWFSGLANTRSVAEFHLLQFLRQQGVPVPRPVAARVQRCGLFYRADILVEKIAGSHDMVAELKKASLPAEVWLRVGAVIRKMHDAGVCHTDLNAHNILLDAEQQAWLIDFDKCQQRSGDEWKRSNLERLLRSLYKEIRRCQICWSEADWQLLLLGYEDSDNNLENKAMSV